MKFIIRSLKVQTNQYSRIFESKEYPLDNVLFNQWDKNGTTIDIGKYVGLNDNEVVEYIKRYYGDDYFPIVKKEIRNIIKNFTEFISGYICSSGKLGLITGNNNNTRSLIYIKAKTACSNI